MVGDEEHQKILVALASLRQQGNLDGVSGTRDQKLAFMNVAHSRRLVVWRGARRGYQLTARGEQFLAKHSLAMAPSGKLKIIPGTRLTLAGLVLAVTGVAAAFWFEWHRPDHSQLARTTSSVTVNTPAGSNGVSTGQPTRDDAGGLRLATTAVSSLEDNRQDAPPEGAASASPAGAESRIPGSTPDRAHGQRRSEDTSAAQEVSTARSRFPAVLRGRRQRLERVGRLRGLDRLTADRTKLRVGGQRFL